jgi:hypothetical protein
MIFYTFLIIVILCYLLNYLYNIFLIKGIYKINIGEYSIRRIKYLLCDKNIDELKQIAINSVGIIPQNPIFNNKNLNNKIVLIVYHKNKPIGFNIMFDYEYESNSCLHVGLVLIDKEYQGKRIQEYAKYNSIFYILENFYKTIYITDIGRSASGLKLFNTIVKTSYPNLLHQNIPTNLYKKIFLNFIKKFKDDTQMSQNAVGDENTFKIKNSIDKNAGVYYLLQFNDSRKSKDSRYNDLINSLGPHDDILSVGKINLFSIFI